MVKNKSITLHKLKNYYLVNGARLTDYKKQKKKRQYRKLLRNFNNIEICNKMLKYKNHSSLKSFDKMFKVHILS